MNEQEIRDQAEKIVDRIKELVKEGSVARVKVVREGDTLVNIPVNAGIIGAVIGLTTAPLAVVTAALVSFGFDCEIEIVKKDGSVLNLSETEIGAKLESLKAAAKEKINGFVGSEPAPDEPVDADAVEVDAEEAAPEAPADDAPEAPAAEEE